MVPWHWKSIYWISESDVSATDGRQLVDKLKHIEAGEAIAKEKGNQASAGKNPKIDASMRSQVEKKSQEAWIKANDARS